MSAGNPVGSSQMLSDLAWHKSRHSGGNGDCVEVARLESGEVAVRHSKSPDGPALVYTPSEIRAFLAGVKDGEFDYLVA